MFAKNNHVHWKRFLNVLFCFCSISLVESIPEGIKFPNSTELHPSTFQAWMNLIDASTSTIEIASFYWTLRSADVYPDASSAQVNLLLFCIATK